jgi:nicotinate-nucleotide pyrophosphorylase (carboxylating)
VELDLATVRSLVDMALREDLGGGGDRTTDAIVPRSLRARGHIVAREPLILAGAFVAREVFHRLDSSLTWQSLEDGTALVAGDELAVIEGAARPILTGERTALNFLQRLSGVATASRRAVEEVAGTGVLILDTRKTTPGLRVLEKYAVSVGGATNHRMGLHDAVLIKDNHVAAAGGVREAVRRALNAGIAPEKIEIEVDDLEGLREALDAGAGRVLLDNFTPEETAQAVTLAGGRAKIECSGGLSVGGLRPYARSGADSLSLGSLTHSVRAVDLSLELELLS